MPADFVLLTGVRQLPLADPLMAILGTPVCRICLHSVLGILINSFVCRQMDSPVAALNLSSKVPEENQRVKPKMRTVR